MDDLTALDFSREEIRKRMMTHAAARWQMRVKDVEASDPLVNYILEACAFEFENTAKNIEATRQRIIDRLASVLCPDVIDLPYPAHGVFHLRPEDPTLDLPQAAQFFHRQTSRATDERTIDLFFSPVTRSHVANADIRYILSEQGLFKIAGRDRLLVERQTRPTGFTDYQSVWLGIELDSRVPSLEYLSLYFDWENESEKNKAAYCRKIQDPNQTGWFLNGEALPVTPGFQTARPDEQRLETELDTLNQLEQEIKGLYDRNFITLGAVPPRDRMDYDPRPHPAAFAFPEPQGQRLFPQPLVWLELRLGRDFPPSAISKIEIRLNCVPVMNRRLNETIQRLQQSLNVFALQSVEEFLLIRRVFDAESNDLYRSSPLRNVEELTENSFMWRPHGVGRFDQRNAREILHYVKQMLLEETKAFSGLGSGVFSQTVETLIRSVEDLNQRLQENVGDGFSVGHPYIFIKPRQRNTNIHIEFWSTNGVAANNIAAGTRLMPYGGRYFMRDEKEDLFLVTTTAGGRNKPTISAKEYQLRQTLLTRQRLVTMRDIEAECQAYFFDRIGGVPVEVTVEKAFAEGLIEGAGYVRCLDVRIKPQYRTELNESEWEAECERCRQHLAGRSAMNLPYRVRLHTNLAKA